jgi:hypothetical protein
MGLDKYTTQAPGLSDHFKYDESNLVSFPCNACMHITKDQEEHPCCNCVHNVCALPNLEVGVFQPTDDSDDRTPPGEE